MKILSHYCHSSKLYVDIQNLGGRECASFSSDTTSRKRHLTIQTFSGMLTQPVRLTTRQNAVPSHSLLKTSTITYLAILGGAVLWCFALVLPPILLSLGGGWEVVGVALYQPFHRICHQLPDRSFQILGASFAVCIRCTAIYFGFLLGTLLYLPACSAGISLSNKRAILISSVIPMLVDVMLDAFGLHASTAVTRVMTGSVFGIIVPLYVIPAAQEAVQEFVAASRFFSPSDAKKGSIHA